MNSEKDKEYCDACMKLGLAEFLSWGRKPNIAILGAEEEHLKCPHDVWHDRMDIHNSLSIIQKNSNGSKKIKFVLPLFEETFGTVRYSIVVPFLFLLLIIFLVCLTLLLLLA